MKYTYISFSTTNIYPVILTSDIQTKGLLEDLTSPCHLTNQLLVVVMSGGNCIDFTF